MNINWFPGHMSKTLRQIEESLKKVDFVIYVLDGRAPFSCLNPEISRLVQNKPVIFVLAKKDMSNPEQNKKWLSYFASIGTSSVAVDLTKSSSSGLILKEVKNVLIEKIERQKSKGINKIFRGMVVGIPNSGKSTLINTLAKFAKTKTGNKAGVTRDIQWVKIADNFELMDTPGTLWPKLDNKFVAENLAFLGAVREEVVDSTELAVLLIAKLSKIAPELLKERFSLEKIEEDSMKTFEAICKTRGFLKKGNEPDFERCGKAVLDDFRKARIGNITLDVYENIFEKKVK